jgi:hypothetical protein
MYFRGLKFEDVEWNQLAVDWVQWRSICEHFN